MSSLVYKILAIFFMIIDHTGALFFPDATLWRVIGRLAMPLFAFQFAIGIHNTRDIKKRIIKLFIFAILVQIPYTFFQAEMKMAVNLNIIFTFLYSALIIYLINTAKEKNNIDVWFVSGIVTLMILLGAETITPVDYGIYGVLLPVMFYYTFNKKYIMSFLFFILWALFVLMNKSFIAFLGIITLAEIPLFFAYNGKKGYKNGQLFYFIYFAHFIVLLFIKAAIN